MALDEEIGARLFKIRAACGRGERDPETLELFAARVKRVTGVDYNPVTLSTLERGKRRWLVGDVFTFARVDPMKRGTGWLAGTDMQADPFADGAEIPTLERESFEEEEQPRRATGTAGRPNAKKRR